MDRKYLMGERIYKKLINSRKNGKKLYVKSYELYKSNDRSHIEVVKFSVESEEYGYVGEFIIDNNKVTQIALRNILEAKKQKIDETDYATVLIVGARYLSSSTKVWLSEIKEKQEKLDESKLELIK